MTTDYTFQTIIDADLAPHYLALGQKKVYLSTGPYPWEYVTKAEPGSTGRFDMRVSVTFTAPHPCGIEFHWFFDLESHEANGSGYYHVLVADLADVLQRLPGDIRRQLDAYLRKWVAALREKGEGFMEIAEDQFGKASVIERLAQV